MYCKTPRYQLLAWQDKAQKLYPTNLKVELLSIVLWALVACISTLFLMVP